MGFDWIDAEYERAMYEHHQKAVMARATQEQRVFLFVEGESEEIAIPILFADTINLDVLGVKIVNYNGHGNLRAALRLLKLTLSNDRPIILTYDNDPASVSSVKKCKDQGLITDLVYQFPIPTDSIVTYSPRHQGGGFEESFPVPIFISAAFGGGILPAKVASQQARFEARFDSAKPWLRQLQKFTANLDFTAWSAKKTALAEGMALKCDKLPPTYRTLVNLIKEVRKIYPIVHPYDVDLP